MATDKGIECTNCGCRDLHVTNSEPLPIGIVRRRRICRHCGKKMITLEGPQKLIDAYWGKKKKR